MHKQSTILVLITAFLAFSFWQIQAAGPPLRNDSLLPKDAILIEAETTTQKEDGVEIVKKEGASGGAAVICRPASKAFYQVNFPSAGTWYIWVRLFCPNPDADSYWVGIDNAEPVPLDNARDGDIGVRFYADPGDSVNSNQAHQIWYWDGGKGVKDPKNYFTVN
ncbi:MAG TPA: hypothetical protein VEC37_14915, partial [Bacillota bacterium]|nr:hypothetical protein [Bacillota bacterium]